MPWILPLGVRTLVLKSACASSHKMRSFLPVVRQWRATALMEPIPNGLSDDLAALTEPMAVATLFQKLPWRRMRIVSSTQSRVGSARIAALIAALDQHPGAIPVLPVVDSLAHAEGDLMGAPARREHAGHDCAAAEERAVEID